MVKIQKFWHALKAHVAALVAGLPIAVMMTPAAIAGDAAIAPGDLYSLSFPAVESALEVHAPESAIGQTVRVAIYDSEKAFLDIVHSKAVAPINDDGLAVVDLEALPSGEYAFVAYLDENDDGMLNRGSFLGRPKEPVLFSNGIRPKFKRPSFSQTKVNIGPGSIVVLDFSEK